MNKSREHLKKLSKLEREALAKKIRMNPEYLRQIASGDRNPSRKTAMKMEKIDPGIRAIDFLYDTEYRR
jgi:ribosome-binding protein aMBF1 (putative translation factor)